MEISSAIKFAMVAESIAIPAISNHDRRKINNGDALLIIEHDHIQLLLEAGGAA